jgi:hypothetical protein
MPIKTFRGLIADGAIDIVSLHTNNGSIGYRIVKMQVMHAEPGEQNAEHTIKVFSVPQTTATNAVDFSDNTLLAVAHIADHSDIAYALDTIVVFDNMTFNQDIYVTHEDTRGALPCNYYIELEQVKLDLDENTVATLKDIRNITAPT